ncbi:MAG: Unknown protein [uncultured Thiotrichaceae bacterium]|uniref:Uncharacterized protein n=1 Tax=uncultured Thiotrichaceae bacterium TaxID=298394 RepID=A0A6S6TMX8_9GAMM|nr:MAG: Unknown protein [uncultured Thiotrichaceae bacterium]
MLLSPEARAEQIIQQEFDEQAGVLNLHGLGLTKVPGV